MVPLIRSIALLLLINMFSLSVHAQQDKYDKAMKAYEQKDYKTSAALLAPFIKAKENALSSTELYNSACIYAMAGQSDEAFRLLDVLATRFFMSNAERLESDSDLTALHNNKQWQALIEKVKQNKQTERARTAIRIRRAIGRAHDLLEKENGNLWGVPLWSNNLLVLDPANKAYSHQSFPNSLWQDSLWSLSLPQRTLNQSNAPQDFAGSRYAIVLTSYLSDSSATIIHELFHLAQEKRLLLNGNPVNYLDTYEARQYLRLEYQSLRKALQLAGTGSTKRQVAAAIRDAVYFRKLRRALGPEYTTAETDIETSEGLANYTGFKLSDIIDKYGMAIKEINGRESAPTYTRTFPYATGPAYGFLFDYLGMDWRHGLDKRYSFGDIFEHDYLHAEVKADTADFRVIAARNNYDRIHQEELSRKTEFDRKTAWFTKTLIDAPLLRVTLVTDTFSRSFDMNGTFVLAGKGTVYTTISGNDITGKNFGSFKTTSTGTADKPAGVLGSLDGRQFSFPLPLRIEGNKVIGDHYEILLNKGWIAKKTSDRGDLEIVREP